MKLPAWFQKLYWWGNASELNLEDHKRTIIVQVANYGTWNQWRWLVREYGKERIKKLIEEIPASEFRSSALKLLLLLLGMKKVKYASRSDYIRAKKGRGKDPHSS